MSEEGNGLYSTTQAAEYLGMTRAQLLYQIRVKGALEPDRTFGKAFAFSRETLDAFEPQLETGGRRPRPLSFTPDMVTIREAARMLNVPYEELLSMVRRGEIETDGTRSGTRYFYRGRLAEIRREMA